MIAAEQCLNTTRGKTPKKNCGGRGGGGGGGGGGRANLDGMVQDRTEN